MAVDGDGARRATASSSAARRSRPATRTRSRSPFDGVACRARPPRRADRGRARDRGGRRSLRDDSAPSLVAARGGAARSQSQGIAARREELARRSRSKPASRSRPRASRSIAPSFTFHDRRRGVERIYGEIVPLDWLPGNEGRVARHAARPARADRRHLAVQLPAQPRRAQGRAGARRGQPDRPPAGVADAGQLAPARRDRARGRLARGRASLCCPASTDAARPLVEDDRIKLLTFTGSPAVGWALKARAGRKRVTLELGGNAAVIVNDDADVAYAAERVAWGGFAYAGQTCISVQRVFVHERSLRRVRDRPRPPRRRARGRRSARRGDRRRPADRRRARAERVEDWIDEARGRRRDVLAGGERDGALWQPTVLANVPRGPARLVRRGVRAARRASTAFDDVDAAIDAAAGASSGCRRASSRTTCA